MRNINTDDNSALENNAIENNAQKGGLYRTLEMGGTSLEAGAAGSVSALVGFHAKNLVSDPATSFFLEHLCTTLPAAPVFALMATAFGFTKKYLEEKEHHPHLTYQAFWAKNGWEAFKFCSAITLAGGGSFMAFTMIMAGLNEGLGSIGSKVLGTAFALLMFASANTHQNLQLPPYKLFLIALVFAGFALGGGMASLFEVGLPLAAFLPAFGGAALPLVGAIGKEVISSARSCCATFRGARGAVADLESQKGPTETTGLLTNNKVVDAGSSGDDLDSDAEKMTKR